MKKDQRELASIPNQITAQPRISHFLPISIPKRRQSDSREEIASTPNEIAAVPDISDFRPMSIAKPEQGEPRKQMASTPNESAGVPDISDFRPISVAKPRQSHSGEASAFDLIDEAAELIRASEQRASQAEEKAERVG